MTDVRDGVTIEVILIAESPKAILVRRVNDEPNAKVWLPLSQIDTGDLDGVGDAAEIEIPRWLAREHGWEDD